MKHIISEEEFYMLLALAEVEKMVLFDQQPSSDSARLIEVLAELWKAGRVVRERGRFKPSGEWMDIIRHMERARYVISLHYADERQPWQLIYTDEAGYIALEQDTNPGKCCLKLQKASPEEYVKEFMENCMLPETLIQSREEAMKLEKQAPEESMEKPGGEPLLQIEKIRAEDGEKENCISIYESPVFLWIHARSPADEFYHIYSAEELEELLVKELKGCAENSAEMR